MSEWASWIGREQHGSDVLTAPLIRRHRATLDHPIDDTAPLPGIHWCLCLPEAATETLGEDGHPRRDLSDSFLPAIDLSRRMWAASTVEFLAPMIAGACVTRTSRIADISEKTGTSGRLTFVTLAHDTSADGTLAVRESQTIVYRGAAGAAAPASAKGDSGGAEWSHRRTITPSEALLFRYSALTFNSHRIHYDLPYARDVEGYPGLVVHGPLIANLLLGLATEVLGLVRRFAFKATAPAFAGQVLDLVARGDGADLTLAALGSNGARHMQASAS